jgi:hypothetical protein
MATDTADRRTAHVRGVTVTFLACILGVIAAVTANTVASGPNDTLGVYVLAGAVFVQFPLHRGLETAGIDLDVEDFGVKDYLYVAFMTFALWFVCWAILLTTGAGV